ncbi:MAG: TIGR03790 family protein [Verrucomicrobia bacterium]|nr:TIGR03790 family protein [Verrucomicrobiota bacterium]
MLFRLLALLLLGAGLLPAQVLRLPGQPGGANDPAALAIVVYNSADPLGKPLAEYYAQKRRIPADRIVAIRCALTEEINRDEYDRDIAEPLRKAFDDNRWWERTRDRPGMNPSSTVTGSRIRYIVLTRGIPLKIAQRTIPYEGDSSSQPSPVREVNGAAVDSELAVLAGFTRNISGFVVNPYFRAFSRVHENGIPWCLIVGRIDGPSDAICRRMIDDAVAVEERGLWGRAYLDARGLGPEDKGLLQGDEWLRKAAKDCDLPVVWDERPDLFEVGYPMKEAALYLGWYAGGVAGPFVRPGWKFQRGAVAIHIHSYSAASIRGENAFWVGPLLAAGAAVSCGNVYEPFLSFTVHFDQLMPRLRAGFTVGEAVYMSMPVLSWMNTLVGDPLYRPFKVAQELATRADLNLLEPEKDFVGGDARESELRVFSTLAHQRRSKATNYIDSEMAKAARRFRSGRIYEGLAAWQVQRGDVAAGLKTYELAREAYSEVDDDQRVTLSMIHAMRGPERRAQGLALARASIGKWIGTPVVDAFRAFERYLDPPPPTPTPVPAASPGKK